MMIGVFSTMTISVLFGAVGVITPIISLTKCKDTSVDLCKAYYNVSMGE